MHATDTFVISTAGLSKSYKGIQALKGLDLKVRRHSIFGFLGPNGAGKSTTIKLLLGLTRPTGGSASIFNLDSVRDSIAIRQRVGYLAQDPRYYDHMTARETLRFAARFFYRDPQKQLGTAAWVMSKPVSRSAFVLAKFFSHALGLLTQAIVIPHIVFYF